MLKHLCCLIFCGDHDTFIKHLFEIELFRNILNDFVNFDQCNASQLNKIIHLNQILYLDSHNNAPVLDHFGKGCAIISILVKGLVEEDDASNARVYALVSREKELAVQTAVFLGVLDTDGVQALCHATCIHADIHIIVLEGLTESCSLHISCLEQHEWE